MWFDVATRNTSSYAYHILFYFSGNKREKKLKTRGMITSWTKYISTIMSHLLFWATNFPSTYSAIWFCNLLHLHKNYNNSTHMDPLILFLKSKAPCLTKLPLIWHYKYVIKLIPHLCALLFLSFRCWAYQILYVHTSFHTTTKFFKYITLHIMLKNPPHSTRLQTSLFGYCMPCIRKFHAVAAVRGFPGASLWGVWGFL
jgi:hypothetical protein